jgi:hypothetical protein
LESSMYENHSPEASLTPTLAWVSPKISVSLLASRVDLFNDLDRQCTDRLQQFVLSPDSQCDNVGYFLYDRLLATGLFPHNNYMLINQLVYIFQWSLKRLQAEDAKPDSIDDLLGWLLLATIIPPASTPEMKQRDFKRLRDGLLTVAADLKCRFLDDLLKPFVEMATEDGQQDTLDLISRLQSLKKKKRRKKAKKCKKPQDLQVAQQSDPHLDARKLYAMVMVSVLGVGWVLLLLFWYLIGAFRG